MIIAIDGTSGSGKSTLAKTLAQKLNFGFFSAGALYRAITVKVLDNNINENDDLGLQKMIDETNIIYTFDGKQNVMKLDGLDITGRLYGEEVSNMVPIVAKKPFIRVFVRKLQKETALYNENIVMEGRDIGSVIFPDAEMKVFVDCKIEERAKRRLGDYENLHEHTSLQKVIDDLKERDYLDTHREISPLVMCENSYLLDTSQRNVEESVKLVLEEMKKRGLVSEEKFNEIYN